MRLVKSGRRALHASIYMQRDAYAGLVPRPLPDFIILSMHVDDTILFVVAARDVSCIKWQY